MNWVSYVRVCIYIYLYPPSLERHSTYPPHPVPYPHPSPPGHHRAPSWSPCVHSSFPLANLVYTWSCIYVNPNLPIHTTLLPALCPHGHSMCLSLHSCPADRFSSAIFLDSVNKCVNIQYFFLSEFTLYDRLWVHPHHYNWPSFVPSYSWGIHRMCVCATSFLIIPC